MSQTVATVGRELCMKKEAAESETCLFLWGNALPMHKAFPRGIWRPGQINHTIGSLPHHFYKDEPGLNWTTFSLKEKKNELQKSSS